MLGKLRVIDIGTMVAAPVAGTLMADFGAYVIKVEQPKVGDTLRDLDPKVGNESLWWNVDARNKKSITLNLRTPQGQEVLKRLVQDADVVLENFRPGTLEKWGIDYESLTKINPRLVMLSVSGFGQTGPLSNRAGYDRMGLAFSGIMGITGFPDRPPVRIGISLADYTTAILGAFSVMTALYHRDVNGGKGQHIDLALYESMFRVSEAMTTAYDQLGTIRARTGNVHFGAAPGNNFETQDGGYIVLTCSGDAIFKRLCTAMNRPDLLDDPDLQGHSNRWARIDELNAIVAQWVISTPIDALTDALDDAGVPYSKVMTIEDIVNHPQYQARENIISVEHPTLGPIKMQGVVPRFSNIPTPNVQAAPSIGQHNDVVYLEQMGFSEDEYQHLKDEGII
ncbi:CoA transferase [Alcaligenaceae bacterium]|nr:CoA transferase [Alcaligenaceae bacterium]